MDQKGSTDECSLNFERRFNAKTILRTCLEQRIIPMRQYQYQCSKVDGADSSGDRFREVSNGSTASDHANTDGIDKKPVVTLFGDSIMLQMHTAAVCTAREAVKFNYIGAYVLPLPMPLLESLVTEVLRDAAAPGHAAVFSFGLWYDWAVDEASSASRLEALIAETDSEWTLQLTNNASTAACEATRTYHSMVAPRNSPLSSWQNFAAADYGQLRRSCPSATGLRAYISDLKRFDETVTRVRHQYKVSAERISWRTVPPQHFNTPGGRFVTAAHLARQGELSNNSKWAKLGRSGTSAVDHIPCQLNTAASSCEDHRNLTALTCTTFATTHQERLAWQRNAVANAVLDGAAAARREAPYRRLNTWATDVRYHYQHVGKGDCTHYCLHSDAVRHWLVQLERVVCASIQDTDLLGRR